MCGKKRGLVSGRTCTDPRSLPPSQPITDCSVQKTWATSTSSLLKRIIKHYQHWSTFFFVTELWFQHLIIRAIIFWAENWKSLTLKPSFYLKTENFQLKKPKCWQKIALSIIKEMSMINWLHHTWILWFDVLIINDLNRPELAMAGRVFRRRSMGTWGGGSGKETSGGSSSSIDNWRIDQELWTID